MGIKLSFTTMHLNDNNCNSNNYQPLQPKSAVNIFENENMYFFYSEVFYYKNIVIKTVMLVAYMYDDFHFVFNNLCM